jgi:hypothetical protein
MTSRSFRTFLGIVALTLAGEPLSLQAKAGAGNAETLYGEALALHRQGKPSAALAKLKEAVALAPKNQTYLDYQSDLELLARREKRDLHALQTPPEMEQSLEKLAQYLAKPARNDWEKARLIYRWITDRINYDVESFFSGKDEDTGADAVLKRRKSVCDGYASLYEELGKRAGLEIVKVSGFAKGYSYVPGEELKEPDHAWNAIKLDGKWYLIDSTWGAGHVDGKAFKKEYTEYYFLTPPEQFIFTHLPEEPKWQLLTPAVSREQFKKWPKVHRDLFELGFAAQQIKARLQDKTFRGLVAGFTYPGPKLTIQAAPLDKHVKVGSKYRFKVEAPGFLDLAITNKDQWFHLKRTGDIFEGEVVVKTKGEFSLNGKMIDQKDDNFWTILEYKGE